MGAAAMRDGNNAPANADGSSISHQIQCEASSVRSAGSEANQVAVARRLRKKRSTSAWTGVVGAGAALLALALASPRRGSRLLGELGQGDASGVFLERRLSQYPPDIILNHDVGYHEDPNNWLVFIHCIGMLYMLLGLNTVCDVYFAGALEVMVTQWGIQADVAGATFMAAGGSAPELFTSLIGAIIAENDVGFGTIVGSAVFNVLFVIGCCGWVAPAGIKLTWWPLFRDSTFYIAGLGILAFFASNQEIEFFEAAILFGFYIVYCIFMYKNPFFEDLAMGAVSKNNKNSSQVAPAEEAKPQENAAEDSNAPAAAYGKLVEDDEGKEQEDNRKSVSKESVATGSSKLSQSLNKGKDGPRITKAPLKFDAPKKQPSKERSASISRQTDPEATPESPPPEEDEEDEDDEEHFFAFPEGAIPQLMWYLKWPITAHLYYCTPEPGERTFLFTFFIALVWIAGYSFLLVWWIEILTEILGWPIIIMGFTVLAAGTSIPDLVSSMAVAKKGEGDMAVSSSIGSNIFDILVGLPIPWMIKIGCVEQDLETKVSVKSPFITFYVIVLLGMVFMTVLSIHMNKWELDKKLGPSMMILWIIFLVLAIFAEMGPESATKHLKWN